MPGLFPGQAAPAAYVVPIRFQACRGAGPWSGWAPGGAPRRGGRSLAPGLGESNSRERLRCFFSPPASRERQNRDDLALDEAEVLRRRRIDGDLVRALRAHPGLRGDAAKPRRPVVGAGEQVAAGLTPAELARDPAAMGSLNQLDLIRRRDVVGPAVEGVHPLPVP